MPKNFALTDPRSKTPVFSDYCRTSVNDKELDALIEKVPLTADQKERDRLKLEAAVRAKNGYTANCAVYFDELYAYGPKIGSIKPIKNVGHPAQLAAFITRAK